MALFESTSGSDDLNRSPSGNSGASPAYDALLYPHHRYRGQFTPQNLAFNANLQEFSQAVGYICALETGGKISPDEAYKQIKKLYKQLKRSKKALNIGDSDDNTDSTSVDE
ncbi:MAG: DUF7219 family protein [Prochlorothrix sp.]|nr:hypothetical protein [Prochlorothrix sp.]